MGNSESTPFGFTMIGIFLCTDDALSHTLAPPPQKVLIFTARKRSLRSLCFYTCLSVILFTGGGGVVTQHALQVSRPTSRGEVEGSGLGWSPGPHQRGKLSSLAWGGSPGPHPRGCLQTHTWGGSPGPHPGWGVCIPACTEADTPPQTSTAVGSTHPTEMHSCYVNNGLVCPSRLMALPKKS